MANVINRMTNANVYLTNKSMLGRAEEITLPDLKNIMSEHKALGMKGALEYASGFEKMEAKIKWNGFYEDVFKQFANPYKALRLMARGSNEEWQGGDKVAEKPYVVYMTCQSKKTPLGAFKQNDNVEFESEFSCTQVKIEYDGSVVLEFDAEANIFIVDGVDILADYRNNLGI